MCVQSFEKPIQVEDVYALPLKGALYEIKGVPLALDPPSMVLIALSFQVLPEVRPQKIDFMDSVRRTHIVFSAALCLFFCKNGAFVNFWRTQSKIGIFQWHILPKVQGEVYKRDQFLSPLPL